ncbi:MULTISPECIES: protein kinase [unclassified Streptomyces]|uniref:serine/threonine-protein kinase n=1 Tax=unclassified Streptomyces TaxID=2593676 RepID=UPI0033A4C7D9
MMVRPWSVRPDLRLTAHAVAGRYRLDGLLGRGGAADVYEALDLRLRRPVAVKIFRPDGEVRGEEHFDDEGRLLAQMEHPGLVTLYDSGREDGRPYLVMRLVRGTTLRRRIAAAPLTPHETARTGAALASALAHVHAAGVVHRDVKPSNVLLDGAGTPYLTDFGISRLLDATTRVETGPLVGTAAYLAPEQVLGRGAGPAADVYSLGLVLLESLKGELEYAGAPLESALARLHRPPVIPAGLPTELAGLVAAMTDPDEAARPDADTCFRLLTAMPGGAVAPPGTAVGPTPGEPPSVPAPPGAPTRPANRRPDPVSHRSGRALTACAALTVLGATLTGSIGAPTAKEETPSRAPQRITAEAPAPRPATGAPTPRTDRATGSPSDRADHPALPPTAPVPLPRPRTASSSGTSVERPAVPSSGGRPGRLPAASPKKPGRLPAASPKKPGPPRAEAARGPARDGSGHRSPKAGAKGERRD